MALITYVTDRATGERSGGFQDNTISLSGVSDVRLDIEREDIASWEQKGDDLVVTLQDGTQILIENFYASDDSGLVSRLVGNGDEVIAAPDISSSLLGLGLLGLVGAGAALAGGSDADTTAPDAPADLADATNEDGTVTLTGTAEPGAVVDVTWPDGTTSQVTADENGDFSATSATAQPEGDITATATDASGNASDPAVLAYDADPSADVTAPVAPADLADATNEDGTVTRSEERRVGKECRSRWSPYH